jgi:hypothetical protein
MKYSIIFISLILLISLCHFGQTQDCLKVFRSSAPKIPLLETGSFALTKDIFKLCQLSQQADIIGIEFNTKVSKSEGKSMLPYVIYILYLAIIFIGGYNDPTGTDFSARPLVKDLYFDVLFTMSINAKWAKTHIHYMASSRDDIRCGTYSVS